MNDVVLWIWLFWASTMIVTIWYKLLKINNMLEIKLEVNLEEPIE